MKISVIGAGTMGNGIAHAFAQSGYKVNLIEQPENEDIANSLNDLKNINIDCMLLFYLSIYLYK